MKYIRLSDHISNIAQGNYYNSKILKKALKCPILNDQDRIILNWYLKGIKWNSKFNDIQEISIKLFVNKY